MQRRYDLTYFVFALVLTTLMVIVDCTRKDCLCIGQGWTQQGNLRDGR